MKLSTGIKTPLFLIGSLFLLLLPIFSFAGDPLRGDSLQKSKTGVKELEAKTEIVFKTMSKSRLYAIIDSILDLDSIDVAEIELVSYYASILNSTMNVEGAHAYNEGIPGQSFYEGFNLDEIFQITPEDSFPEVQFVPITGFNFGSYFHPRNDKINSNYGWRDGRMHRGMDIDLNKGDDVYAAFDGMVRIAKKHNGFGNVVIIRHYNGLETVYGHLSKLKVKAGDKVLSGQLIGLGGSTGRSTGPHLHFEVRFRGQSLNPSNFINFKEYKLNCDTLVIKKSKAGITAYPSNAKLHTVVTGDSWFEIAKLYGITIKELLALNGTDRKYYLRVGQKVRIN
jgi:murein DD-endopeptidase MepM/ murein hydrolase activator NlpD